MNKVLGCCGCLLALVSCAVAEDGPGTYFDSPEGTANVSTVVTNQANVSVRQTVAFLGGSITEMDGFRPRVMRALRAKYSDVAFTEIAAGLSSTCSDTGAFRLEEDVLSKGVPDLFIVEAAVNDDQDGHFTREHCIRGMEGIVRHVLLVNPRCVVVVGLLTNKAQYEQRLAGKMPVPFEAHAAVARHYGAVVADVGTALAESARAGGFSFKEYRDCHPSPEGCDFAARVFMKALACAYDPHVERASVSLPEPLDAKSYCAGRTIPLADLTAGNGWHISRPDWENVPGSKRAYFSRGPSLWSVTPGAETTVAFDGPILGAMLTAGDDAGALEVSIDGGPFGRFALHAYPGLNYPYTHLFAENLADGPHTAVLRVATAERKGVVGSAVRIHRIVVNSVR